MPVPIVLLGPALASPQLRPPQLFPQERVAADHILEAEIRQLVSTENAELLGGMLLQESDMVVEAYAGIARVTLHQWFTNLHRETADSAYLLPLPKGATLDAAEITCGQERIIAESTHRSRSVKGASHSPFLLDSEDVFVWELPALCGEDVAVTVQYLAPIDSHNGRYSLDIPPPPAQREGLPWEVSVIPTRSLTIYIDERMKVSDLRSGDHVLDPASCGHRHGTVASVDPRPGQPVRLSWTLSGASALAYQSASDATGYLAITIEPEVLGKRPARSARELLFVIDNSCSVRGAPYAKAEETILETLAGLTGADTFNLHPLSAESGPLFDRPRTVDADTRQAAVEWLQAFSASSTGSAEGLRRALATPQTNAHRLLLLLTDGHLDEPALHTILRSESRGARIHPIGIGPYANRALLAQLAIEGRGGAIWPEADETPAQTAARLRPLLAAPVLSNLAIDWGGLEIIEQLPARLPDMGLDAPLRVLARYRPDQDAPTTVRIQGDLSQTPIALELVIPAPESSNEALAPLWASEKIRSLSLQGDRDPRQVRDEIVAVALRHGISSRYTTLVGDDNAAPTASEPRPALISTALTALEWSEAPPVALTAPPPRPVRRGKPRKIRMSTVGMNLPSGESTGEIIQLVDAKQPEIAACYQDRLATRPELAGSVALEVSVVEGRVVSLMLAENTTGDASLARCAIRRISLWTYPESVTGKMYLPFALAAVD